MAEKKAPASDVPHKKGDVPDKKEEAKNLAREAVEELEHGDRDEGRFLAEEAKALDPAGAAEVMKGAPAEKARKS
jgi:hypothetical protein